MKVKVAVHRGFKNTALKVNGVLVAGTLPFQGTVVEWDVEERVIISALVKKPKTTKEKK